MLCWDWSSELRLLRQFIGESPVTENRAGFWAPGAVLRRPNLPEIQVFRVVLPRGITMIAESQPSGDTAIASKTLVLYDGICALCNWLVAFLNRHDRRDQFRFAPLQTDFAQDLLHRHDLNPSDLDTVVVLADFQQPSERALTRSEAALWSVVRLGGIWSLFAIARLIPRPLREALYRMIARNRYRVFGKYDACPLPKPKDRHKFLA